MTLLLVSPLWQLGGLPGGTHDAWAHIRRGAAMHGAFEQGVYWPRWQSEAYRGLGEPSFHHYSPGFYWLTALAHSVGLRFDNSVKLVVTAALALSGFGVYAWMRYAFSSAASLVSAAIYLLHPHILTRSMYFVGDYPRLLAYLILPVCIWACTALNTRFRVRYWVAMIVSLLALLFSHILIALLGSTILILYSLLLAFCNRRVDGLFRFSGALFTVALMAASFWLPAIADLSLVQIDNLTQGGFNFTWHFLDWWEFVSFQSPVLDSSSGNPLEPVSRIGLDAASWLVLAAGIASVPVAVHLKQRIWGIAGLFFAVAALALTLRLSEPLWNLIPGLSLMQFPFRFLSIAPLGLLPAAALAIDVWPAGRRWLPGLSLLLVSFLVLYPYLFPAHTSLVSPVAIGTASDTKLLERVNDRSGTTGNDEFLVRDGDLDIVSGKAPEPDAKQLTWISPHEATADLSGQPDPLLLRLHFHPGWSAGKRAALTAGPAGWTQVTDLSDHEQPLVIRWSGTTWQHWGERLSLLGMLVFIASILYPALRYRRGNEKLTEEEVRLPSPRAPLQFPPYTLVAMVGSVLLLIAVHGTLNRPGIGPYLFHSEPGQLAFAAEGQPTTLGDVGKSQVTFLGWEPQSRASASAGGLVRVRIYWQPRGRISEELFTFLHLYAPSLKMSWAADHFWTPRPPSVSWDPEKYYVENIGLNLPSDLPPATYSLVAGMYTSTGERLNVPGSPDNMIHLRTVDVAPMRPGILQRERPPTETPAATDDGLRLQGFELAPAAGSPTLRLFWETTDNVAADWITYIHMHDAHDEIVVQFDGPPLAGLVPTSQWHTRAVYIDSRQLDIPEGIGPGAYQLRIGLYDRVSGERLPFQPDDILTGDFEDGQLLIPLTVTPLDSVPD